MFEALRVGEKPNLLQTLWWQGIALSTLMTAMAWRLSNLELAIYLVSFWHYAVYALAYLLRRVSVRTFMADAVLFKAIALMAYAWAYLTSGPGLISVLVIALGFGLNALAVHTLGAERTYYGFEIGGMRAEWINRFPFSVVPHPMLVGNMIAFAAPLLEPGFRAEWWPLAVGHVALNFATIHMESKAGRMQSSALSFWFAGGVMLYGSLVVFVFVSPGLEAFLIAGLIAAFAASLFHRYNNGVARP